MATLPPASIDAIVTDPPYGINFMGKAWDGKAIAEATARDAAGRAQTGLGPAGRNAGVASGGPRGSSAFGNRAGNAGRYNFSADGNRAFQEWSESWAREAHRILKPGAHLASFGSTRTVHRLAVALEDAGFEIRDTLCWLFGSGFPKSRGLLKPAYEPIILARKPAPRMTPLNIDACKIALDASEDAAKLAARSGGSRGFRRDGYVGGDEDGGLPPGWDNTSGRWPANVVHDGLAEPWARYFYCAKSSRSERNAGLDGMPERRAGVGDERPGGSMHERAGDGKPVHAANHHPTVKPIALMRWLCRLVTPPGGTLLDPFLGSGTTGCAAALEGFAFIGIEQQEDYLDIARRRIDHWTPIIARAAD